MRDNNINLLLEKFSLDIIENSLVYLFLKNKDIREVQNNIIKECINRIDIEAVSRISNYLTNNNIELSLKNIEKIFETLIEPKNRMLNGAFYTPDFIVDYINNNTITKNKEIKVCDCSCGSGAFLVLATKKIAKENNKRIIDTIENNIYGVDIDQRSVKRTKIILSLLALQNNEDKSVINFNIKIGNSLDKASFNWQDEFSQVFKNGGFDCIIGNPPYIRIQDFNKDLKNFLISNFITSKNGNFNLYFAFFELGVSLLKKGGKLGYITPNNYFTSLAGKELRLYMQNNNLIRRIVNFNHLRIFKDSTTYTCVTFLDKDEKQVFEYTTIENKEELARLDKLTFSKVNFDDLNYKKWRLMSEVDFYNIKRIETSGTSLKNLANIKVGIATLKDMLYFVDGNCEKNGFFIKFHNGKEYLIEKEITKRVIKISTVNDDNDAIEDKRRIIFPYKKVKNKHVIISEKELNQKCPNVYNYLISIKDELAKRDKGKRLIRPWYAYGREQGINLSGQKLLTRTFSNKPNFILDLDEESLFCNGYGVFYNKNIRLLQKILNSRIMDYYVRKTSVEIEGNYQCYQKNFIETFSIPIFNNIEEEFLINEKNKDEIDKFLIKKYGLIKL